MKEAKKQKSNMIEPSINKLLEKVDSPFTLVVATSKRARQIVEGSHRLTKVDSEKPVTIATNEINEDKITYIRTKSGIK